MTKTIINNAGLPFCKGCGHTGIAENLEKALQKLAIEPLDVISVSDIGCHGIVDKSLNTHTVHGLHGRSVALASGIAASTSRTGKKVVVFIGDGGATIGMQHLIDAAHRGFDMTVVVHNNMLYGMTGGQPSELTPRGFKTPSTPDGISSTGYNICELISAAGAAYVQRVTGIGDFSDAMAKAIAKKGFSLVEVMEICPSYGLKANPGMKLKKTMEDAGLHEGIFADKDIPPYIPVLRETQPLFGDNDIIFAEYTSSLEKPVRISISGSAGEGVQVAAELLAKAGVIAGLKVSKKGNYPVTVGIGFSNAEVILSPEEILYSGSPEPDVMILCSEDGYNYSLAVARAMKKGLLITDTSLPAIESGAEMISLDMRQKAGAKSASIYAVFEYVRKTGVIPFEALEAIYNSSKMASRLDISKLLG